MVGGAVGAEVVKWTGGFALAALTVIFIFAFSYIAREFLWELSASLGSRSLPAHLQPMDLAWSALNRS